MAIKWTPEQLQVIRDRDRNLLVSAAAGSGKTAVLAERIISLITDQKSPVDLDRLLVVTFTKAAAGEMKERIRDRLSDMIAADPENELLRRQSVLIHHAHISTIHSFCSYVIRNYFYIPGIDPMFRIMDEGESKLMKAECMHDLLEDAFAGEDEHVLDFALSYGSGKNTKTIEKHLLELYETVNAQAWPAEWLRRAEEMWQCGSEKELTDTPYFRFCMDHVRILLTDQRQLAAENLEAAGKPGGPAVYLPALESDLQTIDGLLAQTTFSSLQQAFSGLNFVKLSGKKGKDEDPLLRKEVKRARDSVKDAVTDIGETFFGVPAEEILQEMRLCAVHVRTLCGLLTAFDRRFAEKKRQRNLMDYNDLEHFALNILLKKEADGTLTRTGAAKEIAGGFDHVMIDEYQDSNEIQEAVLSAVSGGADGRCNRFMVGDIKQSIYGFRHADPSVFLEKYDSFGNDPAHALVVDLHSNYRSRREVVDTVNLLFEKLMSRRMGGTDYDERQKLYAEADYPPQDGRCTHETEILLLDKKDPDLENEKDKTEVLRAEAAAVAARIQELRQEMTVWDRDGQAYRPLKYSDCVILVRSSTDYAEVFTKTLGALGIPAHASTRTGYFSAVEVQVVINYLRILDNPLQDIPLASVLFSAFGDCSAKDLARIRMEYPAGRLYTAVRKYAEEGKDPALREKLVRFLAQLEAFRETAGNEPSDRLLWDIYEKTGIRAYAAAMPGGIQRAANLDMLLQKAAAYEKTSYSGIFNFVRYIEELQRSQEDFGEAGLFSESSDAVRIMTIHKSKGLEFPVVFLCGCSHGFNQTDQRKPVLTHKQLGIGLNAVDLESGKKKKGFCKSIIASAIKTEALSEELRVLYVALTRAREKLIMTVAADDLRARIEKALNERKRCVPAASYSLLTEAGSFADWILPVIANDSGFRDAALWVGIPDASFPQDCGFVRAKVCPVGSLVQAEKQSRRRTGEYLQMLPDRNNSRIYEPELFERLQEIGGFSYPYRQEEAVPVKISVSDLKSMQIRSEEELDQAGQVLNEEEKPYPYIPAFMRGEEQAGGGAARGTAYHLFWKHLDYGSLPDLEEEKTDLLPALREMLRSLTERRILTKEEADSIRLKDILAFLRSGLGRRMQAADKKGLLVREQPFTMGIDPGEVSGNWQSDEFLLVQGVIDAYFEEDGKLILVDYKTDHVSDPSGKELKEKYAQQLRMYQRVLEKSTRKSVREAIIYSTYLGKCVMMMSG